MVCPSLGDGGRQPVLEKAREWMALGANVIGGGQGSGPEDIAAISNRVFQEVFDAMEDRAKLMEDDGPYDWDQVQDRLKIDR